MEMKQYRFYAIVIIGILCLIVGGCMEKEKADESIKTLCMAVLHQDSASLKKFNITSDEIRRVMRNKFVAQFQANSGYVFSEAQASRIADAYLDSLKKLVISTAIDRKDGEMTRVVVAVQKFDLSKLDDPVAETELERQMLFMSQEQATEIYTRYLIMKIQQLQPVGIASLNVNCNYDSGRGMWIPSDIEGFFIRLEMAALGMQL